MEDAAHPPPRNRARRAVVPVLLLVACTADGGPARDAGADVSDPTVGIAPPDIPWLEDGTPPIAEPLLTPCPEGWEEVLQAGPSNPDAPERETALRRVTLTVHSRGARSRMPAPRAKPTSRETWGVRR